MAGKLDGKEVGAFDELTLSNAWELEALVEVLAKGVMTKPEVVDMLMELRGPHPCAAASQKAMAG